ncbi:D-serine ammonia-lyase [Lactiplantibacillus pentosus]|jgi:D-serine dehydratase|uniref:Probable D-serine dehydratase n=2 Tax=Lactiplantibacillus pentosus TaxID=1589 RepID=A0A837RDP8_LACPE|nr:D-serine ammonia-lyase [Lactiplantibacillus pentosus]ASG80564.1 D-serine ammonia-lyase [Lactiplantibacillus pentosus]AYJ42749.1 D-serine ammonia-lyase [Lactiplantibacillus pentosus]KRK26222.1 d-serine dehydratase [Lactiplantibacillus pentosus DSM 20314]MBU7496994.1 D-serine ammonia-lyase [Lactiplantibacillus pentosus]MCC3163731.1 D-serine ammonia-lyase [Lactiplantibacillus pentosus]
MDTTVMIEKHPQIKDLMAERPIVWRNPDYGESAELPLTRADIFDAVARWERFAPFLAVAFPETAAMNGVIESPLLKLQHMQPAWEAINHQSLAGQLYLKADSQLPISGSIKSRGGIYEVLKFAEQVAMTHTDLTYMDDYSVLATPKYHDLFAQYGVIVASTGNLALSVGIMAATFGFKTTVYMSHDARQWKKDKLRANGVTVEELNTDFSSVIPVARAAAAKDPHTHFVDDEGSRDLFLGYAVAGVRLQHQLKTQGIPLDDQHPVVVYLPAGVGGSPSGVAFGLKMIMGDAIYPVFCEPTHVPSVTLGMMTKLNEKIAVQDIGLDGLTAADGLAVSRPSRLAGKIMRTLLLGTATFEDNELYKYLTKLLDTEQVMVEPSAAAGFTAIAPITNQFPELAGKNVTHIVWATGGDMMPESERQLDYDLGRKLLLAVEGE